MTNRVILVDNATLSGVERLMGESQIINLNNIDNDILCLEKLITAVLFSDSLIGVDDYKDQYRSARLKKFDYIKFQSIEAGVYDDLTRGAAEFARGMAFSFEGSKPAGDVVSFFESLRIHPQLRWDVFVSSEYLTLSLLVNDTREVRYESAIDSMFRAENTDSSAVASEQGFSPAVSIDQSPDITDIKALVQAFASGNTNYSGPGHKTLLDRFIFGYGWAAERSHFYNAIAAMNEADAYLSPLRDAFCESCCRIEAQSQINSLLEGLKSKTQNTIARIVEPSGRARFAIKMPFFSSYFISKTDNPRQCIELALKTRNDSDFRECRIILQNLMHLSTQDKYKEVNSILELLEGSCTSLMKKYAVSTEGGLQASLSLGIAGPSIGASVKLNQLFRAYRNKPFARVFRNIAQDMLNVERLGSLHDKLCSSIREHKDAIHPKISVTPKFMEHKESASGRPARLAGSAKKNPPAS